MRAGQAEGHWAQALALLDVGQGELGNLEGRRPLAPESWREPETPDFLPFGQIRAQRLGARGGQSRKPGSAGQAQGPLLAARLPCSDPWCAAPPADYFGEQQGLPQASGLASSSLELGRQCPAQALGLPRL